MRKHGGFEGNAQTLRIVARLEKKVQDIDGNPLGLNLTFRTLAAVLKYDRIIPRSRRSDRGLVKGYYASEAELVSKIKASVATPEAPNLPKGGFRTIECSIMDIADDIAYSTYDLEDCLKAGFLTPAGMLSSDPLILEQVAKKVSVELHEPFPATSVLGVLVDIFGNISGYDDGNEIRKAGPEILVSFVERYRASHALASDSRLRTQLSSQLVGEAIDAVEVEINEQFPMLSTARLSRPVRARVEVLKQYTYLTTIFSSRVSLPEYRGYEVVAGVFLALSGPRGHLLMPDDVRSAYLAREGDFDTQMRTVCDFVAGMTDRYAMEFYGRLHSDGAQSMFKPL